MLAIAAGGTASAQTTGWNFDPAWPTSCGGCGGLIGFQVILPGDQTGIAAAYYNSFTNPTSSITYNSGLNQTTILFNSSSSTPIPLGPGPGSYGPSGSPVPHFGFAGVVSGATTGGEMLPPVEMDWLYGASSTISTPTLGISFKSDSKTGTTKYLLEYVTVTSGGQSSGSWFELPYQGGFKADFVGSGSSTVTLSNAQFFISPTQIPLDQLNLNDLPPTDSQWTPIPGIPDGTSVNPGATLPGASVPEPASWVMMLLGIAGLGAGLHSRRRPERSTRTA